MNAVVQSSPKNRKPRSRKPQIPAEQLRDTFLSLPNDGLCDTRTLAAYLCARAQTVEQMRFKGGGPRFIKVGGSVRYRKSDVLAWLDEQSRFSTSDAA